MVVRSEGLILPHKVIQRRIKFSGFIDHYPVPGVFKREICAV